MTTTTTEHGAYRNGVLLDGKYRLRRLLGEGGMSWVWLAQHEALDMPVAIKILKPGTPASSTLEEGRIVARLRHPSIVAVLDSGRTPVDDPFLVMEYLAGSPLSQVLERDQRLVAEAAIELMLPVLDALCFCHAHGVVHRDVKPGNIFLAREGSVTCAKLLDFGVAKPLCTAAPFPELAGTLGYMAPEQVQGDVETDHRADLWAFCAVLYEAVAGRPALEAATWQALLMASADPEIAPLSGDARTTALWSILERGLRRDAAERYAFGDELRDALVGWLAGAGVEAATDRPPRARRYVQWHVSTSPAREGEGSGVRLRGGRYPAAPQGRAA